MIFPPQITIENDSQINENPKNTLSFQTEFYCIHVIKKIKTLRHR